MSERFTILTRRRIVGIAIIGIAIISPLRPARAAPPDVRLALSVGTPRIERVDESFTAVLSDDEAIVHAELLPSGELLLEPRGKGTVRVLLFASRLVRALEIAVGVPLPAIDPAPVGPCAKPRITPACYAAWRLHLQHLPAADAPPIEFEIEGVQEQIRQAQAREGAALDGEIGTERTVIAQVRGAFSTWQAAKAIATSTQSAVNAARISLEGTRAENSVGTRTILDILNAEQELVNAQVQLATARRNAYVAGFSLLAAMGRAGAGDLGFDGGALYNPDVHYQRVRADLSDWDDDGHPQAQSTRTVDTPSQDGAIPPGKLPPDSAGVQP